jgi:Kef-type K+ transport system membrane component KefB
MITLLASGLSTLVQDLGICLVFAALLGVLFERLRVPTIAALLAAGVFIGPIGLSLVKEQRNIETIANLGLTLLLFVIGLEVNLKSLLTSGRTLLLSGVLQVPITIGAALVVFSLARMAGWSALEGRYVALYFAIACAFSSTLLVVKFLQQHLQLDTVTGRLSVGLLIFQDVWAIVILAIQPSFESPAVGPIVLTFIGIAIVAGTAGLAARYVLPAAFRVVARLPELVVTAALGWCFGLGLFGAHLGDALKLVGITTPISVSMEMGALIAGASIGTFPYAYEVVARVSHLRDFFVTLFFVGLGMSIPVPSGIEVLVLAIVLSFVAFALRYLVFLPLLYFTGLDRGNALETSTKLAQISEFCLVIAYLGMQFGHLSDAHVGVIIFAFTVTALATPALFKLSEHLYEIARPLLTALGMKSQAAAIHADAGHAAPRLVILGFHRIASALLHDLERFHADLLPHTLVIDFNVTTHEAIRKRGVEVVYGNVSSAETLKHARADSAEVIVSSIPDELLKGTTNLALARLLRSMNPQATILVIASRTSAIKELLEAGADYAFLVPTEAAQGVLAAIYAALNGGLPSFIESHREQLGTLSERREILD